MENTNELFLIKPKDLELFSGLLTSEAAAAVDDPNVLTVGVAHGALGCGAISVAFDTEVGDVLSLFVAESERRQGAGRALLEGVAASAKRMGVKRLQIVCETAAVPGFADFLTALGFTCIQAIPRFRASLEQLGGMSLPDVPIQNIYPMSELPSRALRNYNQMVYEEPDRLLYLDPDEIDPELSGFCLTSDNLLGGFTAIARQNNGLELINTYLSQECIRYMPALFRFSLNNAGAALPPETPVLMDAVTRPSEQLLRHLLQGLGVQESRVETFTRLV